jgi:DNA-binding HxlR family transcriptional regulator
MYYCIQKDTNADYLNFTYKVFWFNMKQSLNETVVESMVDIQCPVTATLQIIGGKWKPIILWVLSSGTKRFGELKKNMPEVTQKMLTQQLRELETDGIITRRVYAEIPPKVEYSLTEKGHTLGPILKSMCDWGSKHVFEKRTT